MRRGSQKRLPSYRLHKARGLAVVTLNGKHYYLGPYGTKASREEYDRIIAEWLANGRNTLESECRRQSITVAELTERYWSEHVSTYYVKHGQPTSEQGYIRLALRPLEPYAERPVSEFGPVALKAVRDGLIAKRWARSTINGAIQRIQRMFRWAASQEIIPYEVYAALITLTGLRRGRSTARESPPVGPVPESDLEAIIPLLPFPIRGIVRIMRLTGMRPGEARLMRERDLDRTPSIWIYRPSSHKTDYRNRIREIPIGPRGQAVLEEYLSEDPNQFLFRPADAPRSKGRRRRDCYTKDALCVAIRRAARRAGVRPFGPHRIRHTYGTEIRRRFGLDASRTMLGHGDTRVTEIYAERDGRLAREIAQAIG